MYIVSYVYLMQQVDMLVPKKQILQVFYLKHHVYKRHKLSWIRYPQKLIPTKIKQPYHTVLIHV